MTRFVKMGGKWYRLKINRIDDEEIENIETFVESGEPVLLCYDLAEARDVLGSTVDIEMVE